MASKMQHLVVLVVILSGALVVTGFASAQKQVAPASEVAVSGRTTTLGANATEEQNHCFQFAPASDLTLTISPADINRPFPKNGRVTVEIINLNLLGSAGAISPSTPDVSPAMEYELATATIKDGRAIITFKGDANTSAAGPLKTDVHLGSGVPDIQKKIVSPYSNVALITMSSRTTAAKTAEPMKYVYKYVYAYKVWTKNSSECTQKP